MLLYMALKSIQEVRHGPRKWVQPYWKRSIKKSPKTNR